MITTNLGALIPIEPQPSETGEDWLQGFGDVALLIGVVDSQDEVSLVMACKEPVEQRGAHTTDVKKARRARSEASSHHSGGSLAEEEGFGALHHRFGGQSEMLGDGLVGSRGSEAVDADDVPLGADIAVPAQRRPGLDGQPLRDPRR